MIRLLQPWHVNLGKRLVKRPKLYLRDSGLFHSLLSIDAFPQLATHNRLGASWEGFALETAIRAIAKRSEELSFWATHSGAEVLDHVRGAINHAVKLATRADLVLTTHPCISEFGCGHSPTIASTCSSRGRSIKKPAS